jgi:hypothetical protein
MIVKRNILILAVFIIGLSAVQAQEQVTQNSDSVNICLAGFWDNLQLKKWHKNYIFRWSKEEIVLEPLTTFDGKYRKTHRFKIDEIESISKKGQRIYFKLKDNRNYVVYPLIAVNYSVELFYLKKKILNDISKYIQYK